MDRRVPSFRRERSGEHHVTIHKGAHRIHNWVLLIVAFHQDRIERRDAALPETPGTLHQLCDAIEDGGRVALRCRWLAAGRQPDIRNAIANRVNESRTNKTSFPWSAKFSATLVAASAARMRKSGDWSDVDTITTARRRPSSPKASVSNSPTRDRVLPQDQPPPHGPIYAGHHADGSDFSHAGPTEDPNALAETDSQHCVKSAHSGRERLADRDSGSLPKGERDRWFTAGNA